MRAKGARKESKRSSGRTIADRLMDSRNLRRVDPKGTVPSRLRLVLDSAPVIYSNRLAVSSALPGSGDEETPTTSRSFTAWAGRERDIGIGDAMGSPRSGVLLLFCLCRPPRQCAGRTIETAGVDARRAPLGIFVFGRPARRNLRQRVREHRGLGLSAQAVSRFRADLSHGRSRMEC